MKLWLEECPGGFFEQPVPFSETWPASGSMRNGRCVPRPTTGPRTGDAASSSTPGPLFKTPTSYLSMNGGSQHPDKRRAGGHGPTLADEVEWLLPTPAARDWKSGESNLMDRNSRPLNEVIVNLESSGAVSSPPSDAGKECSDGEPRDQLTIWDV